MPAKKKTIRTARPCRRAHRALNPPAVLVATLLHDLAIQDRPRVRVVSPAWSEIDDPYIIAHADPARLDDAVLNEQWQAWCQTRRHQKPSTEIFEAFLEHLECDGYFGLLVNDAPFAFDEPSQRR